MEDLLFSMVLQYCFASSHIDTEKQHTLSFQWHFQAKTPQQASEELSLDQVPLQTELRLKNTALQQERKQKEMVSASQYPDTITITQSENRNSVELKALHLHSSQDETAHPMSSQIEPQNKTKAYTQLLQRYTLA